MKEMSSDSAIQGASSSRMEDDDDLQILEERKREGEQLPEIEAESKRLKVEVSAPVAPKADSLDAVLAASDDALATLANVGPAQKKEHLHKGVLVGLAGHRRPYCLCTLVEGQTKTSSAEDAVQCSAVSCTDGKVTHCDQTAGVHEGRLLLFRAHAGLPFGVFCDTHIAYLRRHIACTYCGKFCLKGEFAVCSCGHLGHLSCGRRDAEAAECGHCGLADLSKRQMSVEWPSAARMSLPPTPPDRPRVLAVAAGAAAPTLSQSALAVLTHMKRPEAKQNIGRVMESLKGGWAPLDQSGSPTRALLAAIEGRRLLDLVYWLEKGASPDSRQDNQGPTALEASVRRQWFMGTLALLAGGADANRPNVAGLTPLAVATELGDTDALHALLEFGANPNAKIPSNGTDGSTALHMAALSGQSGAADLLLRTRGILPNAQDDGGWTPLSWACEHAKVHVVTTLLQRGARPMLRDMEGNICLHWAAYSGSLEIAARLVDVCGAAALDERNVFGDSPAHIAGRQAHWPVLSLFILKGADLLATNNNGETTKAIIDEAAPPEVQMSAKLNLIGKANLKKASTRRIMDSDVSRGREKMAIQVVNEVDTERLPGDFKYVASLVETDDIHVDRRISGFNFCGCVDDCSSGGCPCAAMSELGGNRAPGIVYGPDLRMVQDVDVTLLDSVVECGPACGCHATACHNRVAQRGISQRIEIYKTADRGWAVRALEPIRQGSFLFEYAGELLTTDAGDAREDDSYLFELDVGGASHVIDAKFYGNVSRFVNHSCAPNLFPVRVLWDHQDHRFSHIAFFAKKDINKGDELGFDYGEQFWIVKHQFFRCCCGSAECKYSDAHIADFVREFRLRERQELQNSEE